MPRTLASWAVSTIRGLVGAALLLLPSTAYAACNSWDVSGPWRLFLTDERIVDLVLEQDGVRLGGRASIFGANHETIDQSVHGQIDGSNIFINVRSGDLDRFSGSIDEQGRMGGTKQTEYQQETVEWSANREAKCVLQLGKVKIPEGTTPPDICAAAQSARKRGSPAAPGLERQCSELQAAQPSSGQLPDLAATGIDGPNSLRAGQSGTFAVAIRNKGGAGASVEVNILFVGSLDQTGQVRAGAGLDCDLEPGRSARINAMLVCTGGQLGAGEAATIVVQGRGQDPGAGFLSVTLNNSRSVEEGNYANNLGELGVNID